MAAKTNFVVRPLGHTQNNRHGFAIGPIIGIATDGFTSFYGLDINGVTWGFNRLVTKFLHVGDRCWAPCRPKFAGVILVAAVKPIVENVNTNIVNIIWAGRHNIDDQGMKRCQFILAKLIKLGIHGAFFDDGHHQKRNDHSCCHTERRRPHETFADAHGIEGRQNAHISSPGGGDGQTMRMPRTDFLWFMDGPNIV